MACTTCQKARNLAGTMVDVIKHAATTGKVISKERYEERMKICRGCEFFDDKITLCRACGCYLNLKAWLVAAKCAQMKWPSGIMQ